jgi:hypothetical protein
VELRAFLVGGEVNLALAHSANEPELALLHQVVKATASRLSEFGRGGSGGAADFAASGLSAANVERLLRRIKKPMT